MGSNNNIQETKLVVIDDYILCQLLGTGFDYAFLPAANTRGGGGILVTWKASEWLALCISTCTFSVSVRLKCLASGLQWWLTSVYGPSCGTDKPLFLTGFHDLQRLCLALWLLVGKFNQIYSAEDKNNDILPR
jgi:hypothetical protein